MANCCRFYQHLGSDRRVQHTCEVALGTSVDLQISLVHHGRVGRLARLQVAGTSSCALQKLVENRQCAVRI